MATESVSPQVPLIAEPTAVCDLLRGWLMRALSSEAMAWMDAAIERQHSTVDERRLAIDLGLVGRKVGRSDLVLTTDELNNAQAVRGRWQPETWSTDEAARVAILLSTYRGEEAAFADRLDRLCTTAAITEHVAYLKGFAVFPGPRALHNRAREGVRSSSRPVFEAIACRNPYPFDYFDDDAWNQMVVKCVFVGTPIETISGLHARRNPKGIQMLRDLVSERQAAGRSSPECVHRFIAGDH
jgi:hypothetical protein